LLDLLRAISPCAAHYNAVMSKELTPAKRRDLKARAHALHPVVMIGNDGLTPPVLKAIDEALRAHELIKIRAPGEDRDAREALLAAIAAATGASPVQHIGKVLVVWRERPADAPVESPPAPRSRPRAKARTPARPKRASASPRETPAGPRAPGAVGPARPGRAPRMLPRRGRPTRSGRR
jgi:putative YhbY family RNA-binding protein